MIPNRFSPSSSRPWQGSQAQGHSKERVDSDSAKRTSKKESPPNEPPSQSKGPALKRADSLPARLPSNPIERTEVNPVRKQITRAKLDTTPPEDFKPPENSRRFPGMTSSERKIEGAIQKHWNLTTNPVVYGEIEAELKRHPELMGILKDHHPDFDSLKPDAKAETLKLLKGNPAYTVALTKVTNEVQGIPTAPTAIRPMKPWEQHSLGTAIRELNEDARKHPYHIHGETAITGTKEGKITQFNYTAGLHSLAIPAKGDKYHLHTHPPYLEPATSAASSADHSLAAALYTRDNNKTRMYVTNGKNVLHIPPDSTELVLLIPDRELEKTMGKFPVANSVPNPERPPYPFTNQEAPAAFNKKWEPPAGWTPPVRD